MHRANASDPHNYDLVVESHNLGLEIAAEIIVHAVELGRPLGAATSPLLRTAAPDRGSAKAEQSLPTSELWGAPLQPPDPTALPTPPVTQTNESPGDEAANL
jgi:hypothetical protein